MNNEVPIIYPIFPKIIYKKNLSSLKDKKLHSLKKECNKVKYTMVPKEDSKKISQSSIDRYIFNNKEFKNLKNLILKEFNDFKNKMLFYTYNKFKITTSWIAKVDEGKESNWHNHNNSFYSGVFYINVEKDMGDIEFHNFENSRFLINAESYNIYNSKRFLITPKNKDLIFFPSELYHKIKNNNKKDSRLSVAFNIIPTGKIGSGDSELII